MTLTFAGCADRGAVIDPQAAAAAERRRPALPTPPETFGRPVPVPVLAKGQDVRVALARSRNAHKSANARLTNDRKFYDDVRRDFSRGQ
jgi:hypothetical protein